MASRRLMEKVFIVVIVAITASTACADIYNFNGVNVDVEYWAGSGANEAIIVVDFDLQDIFNFGFRWDDPAQGDPAITGWDALDAIGQVTNGLVVTAHYDGGVGGMFVDDLSYDGGTPYTGGNGWAYCVSTDGQSWGLSWDGASDRLLSNYDWDGWAWGGWQQDTLGNWTCRAVGEPIPEPVTLALLGIGGLLMRRRNK